MCFMAVFFTFFRQKNKINRQITMKKLYEKYRGKLARLNESVVGTIVGYSTNHLILLLEEGIDTQSSFSLDDLGEEEHYIDFSLTGECEVCLFSWIDENQIGKWKKEVK